MIAPSTPRPTTLATRGASCGRTALSRRARPQASRTAPGSSSSATPSIGPGTLSGVRHPPPAFRASAIDSTLSMGPYASHRMPKHSHSLAPMTGRSQRSTLTGSRHASSHQTHRETNARPSPTLHFAASLPRNRKAPRSQDRGVLPSPDGRPIVAAALNRAGRTRVEIAREQIRDKRCVVMAGTLQTGIGG